MVVMADIRITETVEQVEVGVVVVLDKYQACQVVVEVLVLILIQV